VTRILARLSLAVFLSAAVSPCGLVPFHAMAAAHPGSDASPHASSQARPSSVHARADRPAALGAPASLEICGADIAAPSQKLEPAVAAHGAHLVPALAAVSPRECDFRSRAGARAWAGPPDPPPDVFALTRRLRL